MFFHFFFPQNTIKLTFTQKRIWMCVYGFTIIYIGLKKCSSWRRFQHSLIPLIWEQKSWLWISSIFVRAYSTLRQVSDDWWIFAGMARRSSLYKFTFGLRRRLVKILIQKLSGNFQVQGGKDCKLEDCVPRIQWNWCRTKSTTCFASSFIV